MPTDVQTRIRRQPLLTAWLIVCALLLQPLAAAWTGPSCDAADDCCCSPGYEVEAAAVSSCCTASKEAPLHTQPELRGGGCGCQMEDGLPSGPLTAVPATVVALELDRDFAADRVPLPASLVGSLVVRPEVAPPDAGPSAASSSLLVRRLRSGGLLAHLARLAVARL